jgi:hypothetical protein
MRGRPLGRGRSARRRAIASRLRRAPNDELRAIGDVHAGTLYWMLDGGGCQLADFTNAVAYDVGPPIPTPFVHATKTFE